MPAGGEVLELWKRARTHSGRAKSRRVLAAPLVVVGAVLVAVALTGRNGGTLASPSMIAGAALLGVGALLLGSSGLHAARAKGMRGAVERRLDYPEELDLLELRARAEELRERAPRLLKLKAGYAEAVSKFKSDGGERGPDQGLGVALAGIEEMRPDVERLVSELDALEGDWRSGKGGERSGGERVRGFVDGFREKVSDLERLVDKIIS